MTSFTWCCKRHIHLWEGSSTCFQQFESLLQLISTQFSTAGCFRLPPPVRHHAILEVVWHQRCSASTTPLKSLDLQEVAHLHLCIPEEVIIILSLELGGDSANIGKKLSLLMRRTRISRVGGCLWGHTSGLNDVHKVLIGHPAKIMPL